MYVCVCVRVWMRHAAQLKLKVEQCIKCGSALGFWSVHMAIIKCPSLPHSLSLAYSLSLSVSHSPACACVSVVCDLVPEVSVSVCPSGLTLTEQWSGEWQRDKQRLSQRQSSCCVYKFSVCLSIDRQTRQFDWLFCWYSTSSFSFHLRRSNFALRSYCLRCIFREFIPAYLLLSRRRLVNLIYTVSSLPYFYKLILMWELSGCACFHGYLLRYIEFMQEFSAFLYSLKFVKKGIVTFFKCKQKEKWWTPESIYYNH